MGLFRVEVLPDPFAVSLEVELSFCHHVVLNFLVALFCPEVKDISDVRVFGLNLSQVTLQLS